jgi:2-oxoglutarate ferredoxin oxidoreductase subunit alpha
MVEKRLHKKLLIMKKESIPPVLYGNEDYKILTLVWGSNYYAVKEAVDNLDDEDIAMLFFKQVYPLSPSTMRYLDTAEEITIVENNATCQFGNLIQLETGLQIPEKNRLLKYDGLPFPVEQISKFLSKVGG